MRFFSLAALLLVAACDAASGDDPSDGTRGPCAGGGQVFGEVECGPIETAEDACWKLVACGAIALDRGDDDDRDWGGCVDRIETTDDPTAAVMIACVEVASCEELLVNDAPANSYEWPDCLEFR